MAFGPGWPGRAEGGRGLGREGPLLYSGACLARPAMNPNVLDFEQPIAELEAKIADLRQSSHGSSINIEDEVGKLQGKLHSRTQQIFAALTPWQVAQVARHPARPYTLDYLERAFDEFEEMAGDRAYADDPAIVGGLARIDGRAVMVIGHQKGRDTKAKIRRNFGMPRPEGYRKALRLMETAQRFALPILTFIDTPGAYPGVGAEERGQSEAIARNLLVMSQLEVPIICTVIGEGGSGGALAIGVGDRTLMLEYATYSVISPEGCASILWKTAEKAKDAAEALAITSPRLKELGLIDRIVPEPLGGAHRDPAAMARSTRWAPSLAFTIVARTPGLSGDWLMASRMSFSVLAGAAMAMLAVWPFTVMASIPVPTAVAASGKPMERRRWAEARFITSME
ncbi:MAG TPA: acetyl-CoA carboxylase carboxyltransferase subunit alpha [Rhodospirillales bacterium]|nr:acetyl-CoA carboxylase carboxyltransferase subunit alpha [Rhodospirillales bacterium]